mgnify:CR=1 FL=1
MKVEAMDIEEENAIQDIIDDDDGGGGGNNNNKLREYFLHTSHYSATWHVLTQSCKQPYEWILIFFTFYKWCHKTYMVVSGFKPRAHTLNPNLVPPKKRKKSTEDITLQNNN